MQIIANNISKSYNGFEFVIKNFSYSFNHSNCYCITGNNGSGKSTILRLLAGLSQPTSGTIHYEECRKNFLGYVAPAMNLYEDLTVKELCEFQFSSETVASFSREMIEKYELDTLMNKPIRSLSSGQKQRVKLFVASSNQPDILLLDEPSTNLDTRGFSIIENIIDDYKKNQKIIIIASNVQNEIDLTNVQIPLQ